MKVLQAASIMITLEGIAEVTGMVCSDYYNRIGNFLHLLFSGKFVRAW